MKIESKSELYEWLDDKSTIRNKEFRYSREIVFEYITERNEKFYSYMVSHSYENGIDSYQFPIKCREVKLVEVMKKEWIEV